MATVGGDTEYGVPARCTTDGNCIMYLVDFELNGQSAPLIERGARGAFVTCVVQTRNIIEAIEKSTSALVEDKYVINKIERVLWFDKSEWQHDKSILDLVKTARQTKSVCYSEFRSW